MSGCAAHVGPRIRSCHQLEADFVPFLSLPFESLSWAEGRYFIDLSLKVLGLNLTAPKAGPCPSGEQGEKRQYISHRLESNIRPSCQDGNEDYGGQRQGPMPQPSVPQVITAAFQFSAVVFQTGCGNCVRPRTVPPDSAAKMRPVR